MSRTPSAYISPIEFETGSENLRISSDFVVSNDASEFTLFVQATKSDPQTPETQTVVWKTNLYTIKRNMLLEGDVQDVFLKKMELVDGRIIAETELGEMYYLDPATGAFVNGSVFKFIRD